MNSLPPGMLPCAVATCSAPTTVLQILNDRIDVVFRYLNMEVVCASPPANLELVTFNVPPRARAHEQQPVVQTASGAKPSSHLQAHMFITRGSTEPPLSSTNASPALPCNCAERCSRLLC